MLFDVARAGRSALLLGTLLVLPSACVVGTDEQAHEDDVEEAIGTSSEALSGADSVATAVVSSCSTTSVKGLATQLVEEIQCLRPGTLARIDGKPGITLGSAVFPWLQAPVANALVSARNARGATMTLNSGLRTLPQQFLLYRWYQTGRCGISLAAKPGNSNHESALAIDIQDSAGWRTYLTNRSMRWLGSSDPMHYDYVGSDSVSLKGLSVRAFQRLWNRNHPEDLIAEDGLYGPATESRLSKSPSGGFPVGACTTTKTVSDEPEPPAADAPAPTEVPMVPDATEPEEGTSPTASDSDAFGTSDESAPTDESSPSGPTADSGCAVSRGTASDRTSFAASALLVGAVIAAARRRRRA